jgi:signal recognition particle subunit SRP54
MEAKMRKAAFSITDFMKLQKQMKFLGGLEGILGMLPIPGMNKEMRESLAHGGEKQFARIEAMVNSMTPAERDRPEIIEDGRKARIAKGCGVPVEEVDKFLTQFEQMRAMMQQLTQITDLFSGKASASDDGEDEDSAEEAVHPSTTGGLTMKRSMGKKKKKKEEEDDDPWGFGDLFKPKQPSRHPRRPF